MNYQITHRYTGDVIWSGEIADWLPRSDSHDNIIQPTSGSPRKLLFRLDPEGENPVLVMHGST